MSTAYDIFVYPNLCQVQTHPDRLAVVGNLLGLDWAPPERCRVLEIGCGDGANLLPLAAAFPASNFWGFDLAETRVKAGRAAVADLGVENLELFHSDILSFPFQGEPFDYIIAHGIYSWIPPEARERLLAICRARLAPQGIAYISYNCLPGCHVRRMVGDIMRFHIRTIEDSAERVRQAMAVCHFIANSIEKPDTYQQIFKEQLEQIQRCGAGHLFHDDLAEINHAVYFHQFMAHAARHDLQYLGEAEFFGMQDHIFSEEARQVLVKMEDSRLTREQYLDFAKCRRFRQTLLCHREVQIRYPPDPSAIERFHISSQSQGKLVRTDSEGRPIERFADSRGGALEVGHPLGIRALHLLADRWPTTCSFADLFQAASTEEEVNVSAQIENQRQLMKILMEAYRAGIVDFRRTPVRCVSQPSHRPTASRFARWQLTRFRTVTTLRGDNLRVEDEIGKRLIQLLDGTRTWAELEQSLPIATSPATGAEAESNGKLSKRLEELARLALLEA